MMRPPLRARHDSSRTSSAYATCAPSSLCWTRWHWPTTSYACPGWVLYPDPGGECRRHRGEPGHAPPETSGCPPPGSPQFAMPGTSGRYTAWPSVCRSRVPRTWFPQSEKDLAAIEVDKPGGPEACDQGTLLLRHARESVAGRHRQRSCWPPSAEPRRSCRPGEIIVQEMIPGGGEQQYAYCAFFREGRPVASMTVRRRRQHPSDFGRASTYVETISLPELAEPSCRFLTRDRLLRAGRTRIQARSS